MSPGVFITGTDTGVGKTVVAQALVLSFRAEGQRPGVMKPVESGCPRVNGALVPRDALALLAASGDYQPLSLVNPYAFEHAVAPALAAEMEDVTIQMDVILGAYRTLAQRCDLMIVEGAGGLLAPVNAHLRTLDLVRAFGLPLVVVTRNTLGAINHTALTVEAAESAGVPIAGVILNQLDSTENNATRTNAASIARWVRAPFLGRFACLSKIDETSLRHAAFGLDLLSLRRSAERPILVSNEVSDEPRGAS